MVWESFRCLLTTSGGLLCAFYWAVTSVWPLYHGRPSSTFWKVFLSPENNAGALSERPSSSWSLPWRRSFSPITQTGPTASSRKRPGDSWLPPLTDDRGHCAHWELHCSRHFSVLFTRSQWKLLSDQCTWVQVWLSWHKLWILICMLYFSSSLNLCVILRWKRILD